MHLAALNNDQLHPPFQLTVRASSVVNSTSGSFPDCRVIVSDKSKPHSFSGWDPHSHISLAAEGLEDLFPACLFETVPTYGIIGSFTVGNHLWLAFIKEVELVGNLLGNTIYSLKKLGFLQLSTFDLTLDISNQASVQEELATYQDLLENGRFFFSYTYPLWNHLQFQNTSASSPAVFKKELERQKRYIWNQHLLQLSCNDSERFLIRMIRGHVETKVFDRFNMTFISRIDHRNAGTRFTVRGLTEAGEPGNSVESEVILATDKTVASHLQYRGSLPLLWSQKIKRLAYKPPVVIHNTNTRMVHRAITRHFEDLKEHVLPGRIHILNLLRNCGDENRLTKSLEVKLRDIALMRLEYHPIPLGWGAKCLAKLVDEIETAVSENGFFLASLGANGKISQIQSIQTGLFRTNCMDCVDRTSIAQFGIINRLFPEILTGVFSSSASSSESSSLNSALRHGWARMVNSIAFYYTGTGIVNETIIRDGASCQGYGWKDQLICSTRYFKNNTHDLNKKIWLDRFLRLGVAFAPYTSLPQFHISKEHIRLWRALFGPAPAYRIIPISTSLIEKLSGEELVQLKSKALADLVNLATLNDYCRSKNIDVDHLLLSLPIINSFSLTRLNLD